MTDRARPARAQREAPRGAPPAAVRGGASQPRDAARASAAGPRRDAALAFLVALPALLLVAPLGGGRPPLVADPSPELAAAGWTALGVLPALGWLVLRGGAERPRAALALGVAWIVALAARFGAHDTLGADRGVLVLASGTALVVAGATLGEAGRRAFAAVAALLGLALVATSVHAPRAFELPGLDDARAAGWLGTVTWTGLVGNTGDLSEAALPAGILGLGVFLHGPRGLRVLGLVAALGHALYAGLVPVHAGTLGWLAAAAVAGLAGIGRPEARRLARLALVAALVAVAATGARTIAAGGAAGAAQGAGNAAPTVGTAAPGMPGMPGGVDAAELGGVGFRLATWRGTLALVAAHPLGVGVGQFQAAFPPFRDRAELAASSRGRSEPSPQEVEHPHHDALLALAELGVVGGGAFVAFLVLVAAGALRSLRSFDPLRAAFGLAALAIVVNGLVNAPLLGGTLSAALGWPVIGAAVGGATRLGAARPVAGRLARLAPLLLALVLAVQARTAWSLVEHGRALSTLPDARVVVDGEERIDAARLEALLGRALAARPDSTLALEKRHELLVARAAPPAERRALLERILEQRPHTFSARVALGNLEASSGHHDAARAAYEAAAQVDADHPALLVNRLTLALDARDVAAVRDALAAARAGGALDDAGLEARAAAQLLRGRLEEAAVLLAEWSSSSEGGGTPGAGAPEASPVPRYDPLDPNDAYQAQKALREAGHEALAEGFLCAFQLHMARANRRDGLHEAAVRMARQARMRGAAWPKLAAPDGALRLELALAHLAAGNTEAARQALAEAPIPVADLRCLEAEERALLVDAGLISIQAGHLVVPDD